MFCQTGAAYSKIEIEILCILLFLNRDKNSQNSPKRMHPSFEWSHLENVLSEDAKARTNLY